MKFSIIVPIYNVEKYLDKCLKSLINQTYSDYEIICIDDGSTDSSLEVLKKYQDEDRILIYQNDSNRGLSYTRNRGMSYAHGEYIIFVDSDDWIYQETLEVLEKKTINKPDIIFYNMKIYNEGIWTKSHLHTHRNSNIYLEECKGIQRLEDFYANNEDKIEVCRQAFKTSFLRGSGLKFEPNIVHEDNLFSIQCAILASKVVDTNEFLYVYRRRDDSICSCMNIKRMHSLFYVYKELQRFMQNYQYCKESLYLKDYLNRLRSQIWKMHNFFLDDIELSVGTEGDKTAYRNAFENDNTYFYLNYTKSQIERIKCYKTIDLYGAGYVAAEFTKLARNIGVTVQHIWVKSMCGNMNFINRIPVDSIYSNSKTKQNKIIIAIESINVKKTEMELNELGYRDVIYYTEI